MPVGLTTGIWATGGDPAGLQRAVAAWAGLGPAARPDFASVNVAEPGGAQLARVLRAAGICIEAGVRTVEDARALAAGALPGALLRILVEFVEPPAGSAAARAGEILTVLDAAGLAAPRLLHGEDETCWPLVEHAGRLGLATRIGLEDVTAGPDGEPATGNAELVAKALRVWARARSSAGRPGPRAPRG